MIVHPVQNWFSYLTYFVNIFNIVMCDVQAGNSGGYSRAYEGRDWTGGGRISGRSAESWENKEADGRCYSEHD